MQHHPLGISNLRESFKFEVISQHRSAFNRQISEAIDIKNSEYPLMNNKDQYNHCIIPEITRGERGWVIGETQESKEIKKQQLRIAREARKEQLKNQSSQKPEKKENKKKKRRQKKEIIKEVGFKRVEDKNGRKYYKKYINTGMRRYTSKETIRILKESCMILEIYRVKSPEYPETEPTRFTRNGRKRKRRKRRNNGKKNKNSAAQE